MIRLTKWGLLLLASVAMAGEPVFVAQDGKPGAPGTREEPLATVGEALGRLAPEGGTIRLRAGSYQESVHIAGRGGPVVVEAEPGEEVRFEGGRKLSGWTPWPEAEGLYTAPAKEVLSMWDPVRHIRYLHQMDAHGVRAWPGSFVEMEDGALLVHPAEGAAPEELRANQLEVGFEITRARTTLRGLRFADYLGTTGAAAVRINASDVVVEDCLMENMVRGIVVERGARETRIIGCTIRDVATGIQVGGIGIEVERCTILAATGRYAIRGEAEYDWSNGIRFYHPAEKGRIRHNLTAGFWSGMYHKTTPGKDGAKPFLCEGNVFLDNIKTGTAKQALAVYRQNIVYGGSTTFTRLKNTGAQVEGNYFFGHSPRVKEAAHGEGNLVGGDPFRDRAAGDFALVNPSLLPEGVSTALETTFAKEVAWPKALAEHYREVEPGVLRWGTPVVAASAQGAVITLRLTAPSSGELHYRPVGSSAPWRTVRAVSAGFSSSETLNAFEWPDDAPDEDRSIVARLAFALAPPAIKADTEYEARVEVAGAAQQPEPFRFTTRGPVRTHTLGSGQSLQDALDRALPGDTVQLAGEVFTEPAILLHGGTEGHRITLEGAGAGQTILDGGKRSAAFLELRGAPHVVVRGVEVRHFDRAGIVVEESPHTVVEQCLFRNKRQGRGMVQGTGLLLKSSPHSRVVYNTFTRLLYGVQAISSPYLVLEHNTAFNNIFSAAQLKDSALGSKVRYNSFTFTGNISFYLVEPDKKAFASLVCDFNNYGTSIRKIGDIASRAYAEAGVTPGEPEPSFEIPARYGQLSGSKRIIDFIGARSERDRQRFFNMAEWRKFSGKDTHSIYADPAYAEPLRGDFRLLPGSPNQLPGGELIGSATLVEQASHALR